jgi:3'(2'), 5'-bisphosphate nucleotidase
VTGDDARLAADLATAAGQTLLRVREDLPAGNERGLAGDRASHDLIVGRLAALRPDDVVLSEESADPQGRSSARRVWIVDPLDGTREFAEDGRADWAVHVALWQDGDLVAGAVALPAAAACYATDAPPAPPAVGGGPIRLTASRTRPPAFLDTLADALGAVLVPMGSAGAKCAAVWRGEADAYVHAGGQHEWDSAAPVAVARAAGLHASRLDGSPLRYNRTVPLLPDLLVCRPELAGPLLTRLRAVVPAPASPSPRPR